MSDAGLTQLHPGVFSTINSDQTTYQTASGNVTMFVADVFEKGPDGKIEFVSTPSEFMFKYGEPNYSKYGQAAYNVLNFLKAGGQAYVMRILPNDATYAHSILNIQTRVIRNGKKVAIDNFKTVDVDDVFIRPTISLVRRNNLTEDMLISELNQDRKDETTVDGYENNFLMLVTPNGRGVSYNNLGYRLTNNDSFTTISNTRIYNFEVVQFNSDSTTATLIEGPYYVSFDPDAVSENQESMFIEEVINRQSKYLNVKVNLKSLKRITSLINPDAKSTLIDVLTGGVDDDRPIKHFNPITNREEDIHLTLHKYNSAGRPVLDQGRPSINSPRPTDPVQAALVALDNGIRENSYTRASEKLQHMREIFPRLASERFTEFHDGVNRIFTVTGEEERSQEFSGTLATTIKEKLNKDQGTSLYGKYKTALQTYKGAKSEENLSTLNNLINEITELYRINLLPESNKLAASYTLVEHNTPNANITAKYASDVSHILDLIARKDQINIFSTKHRSLIYDIQRLIFQYQLGSSNTSTLEGFRIVLNAVEGELRFIYENLVSIAYVSEEIPEDIKNKFSEDPKQTESLMVKYLKALEDVRDMESGILPITTDKRNSIFSTANTICNDLLEMISNVSITAIEKYVKELVEESSAKLMTDAKEFVTAITAMTKTTTTYTEHSLRENSRQQIQIEISRVNNMGSKFFNTNLVDFANSIKLLLGSDGSFEYQALSSNSERNEAIRKELIRAYSGAINTDVLNTDLLRFNVIMDARYHNDVKKAITELARSSRRDFIFLATDAGPTFTVTPQDSLEWRRKDFDLSSEFVAIYSQDLTYFDEYTGRDIRFTPTYVLASKIPQLATQYGLHYPLAGKRRGVVDGFKTVSWTPNSAYREKLYKAKINYIRQDTKTTRIDSQLTSINSTGAVSYLNNMFTILEMKRGAEDLLTGYQFEFNDDETVSTLYTELNNYLGRFTSNRSCESVTVDISSSDYDKSQRILRVRISIKFTSVIERIVLDLNVSK